MAHRYSARHPVLVVMYGNQKDPYYDAVAPGDHPDDALRLPARNQVCSSPMPLA
jgi:hypothetical protein